MLESRKISRKKIKKINIFFPPLLLRELKAYSKRSILKNRFTYFTFMILFGVIFRTFEGAYTKVVAK